MSSVYKAMKKAEEEQSGTQTKESDALPLSELTSLAQGSEADDSITVRISAVEITDLKLRTESRIFGQDENTAAGTEQFRLLLGRLLHLQTRTPLKRLLITSARRGEGKTHVSANLAITMARETGRRVLLVDADFRKPDVHKVFGIPNEFGLSDILRKGRDTWKAIRKVKGLNLYLLTAGSAIDEPPAPSSLLMLKEPLDEINPAFDCVIIDSPPVLVAADAPLLAKLADGILFVVGASETPRDVVIKAKGMLGSVPVVGAVLNSARRVSDRHAYDNEQDKIHKHKKEATENGEAQKVLDGIFR